MDIRLQKGLDRLRELVKVLSRHRMGLRHGAGYTGTVWQRFSFVVFEPLPVLTPLWTTLGNRLMDRVLSASTGLTQEELLSLRWRDMDKDLLFISAQGALQAPRHLPV